ncbi:hypothetical protein CS063_02350 [Sporanaerobium hydrogeniformans]|uniref:Uncharacterized protein n=1 Tax=Sporanaerobium hydrogeniformans TaxID=3072179 RepID=A0AC61DI05_9FIRM|nr:hypothetical protein [Sporanaerobium hydrogeniformans]PHV72338.1 hypothetical protein CS063_02350 [Sporanaerobium hydrogeniformans]
MKWKENGFSLLEIAVILALIGLLGIAALPNMQMIYKQQTNKLAKEMALDLTTQRAQCILSATTGEVLLTQSVIGGNYDCYQLSPANIDITGREVSQNEGGSSQMKIIMQTSTASLVAPTLMVKFDPEGKIRDTLDTEVLELTINISYNKAQTELKMNGLTGQFEIK